MAKLPYVDQNGLVRVWGKVKAYVQSAISGLYTKPSEGIPSTDMTTEVQTSLGKADTALQSFTETDPTVPAWAKAAEKPTYTAAEVGALPDDTELFSGSYNDLTDKPTIPDAQVQSDWTEADSTKVDYIKNKPSLATVATSGSYADLSNKPSIPSAQIQSDWSQSDNTALDYIKNKPSIPAAGLPTGGNAGQVLCKTDGSTDYAVGWTNQTQNYPSAYCTTSGSTAAKKASCTLYAAQANSYLHVLIGSNNTSASALTLNVNSEGAKPLYINGTASSATNYTLPKGTYIVFYDGTNYYFRTDGKIQAPSGTLISTSSTSGLIKNDGTIDTTSYGTYSKPSGGIPAADLASGVIPTVPTISTDISTDGSSDTKTASPKAVKTFVEGKGYTTNTGTITSVKMNGSTVASSGEADLGTVITSETSLSLGSTSGAGNAVTDLSVSGHTITMTKGSTFLTSHQDISGKEDTSNKVTSIDSNSTDTQYPSAKCIYDLVGDIETILASI